MAHKDPKLMESYLEECATELNDLAELDTMEMYRHLTSLGNDLERQGTPPHTPENFVPGCTSNVYIHAKYDDGAVYFLGSSEALVVRGYVAILVEALSGLAPLDIIERAPRSIEQFAQVTNIRATLTPSRANAFGNIFKMMQEKARTFLETSHE